MAVRSAREHLEAAAAALVADRERIDFELGLLREMIARLDAPQSAVVSPVGVSPVGEERLSPGRTIREITFDMGRAGEEITLKEVVRRAAAEGNTAQYESISSLLSKLSKEGYLRKNPGRGSYSFITDQPKHLRVVPAAEMLSATQAEPLAEDEPEVHAS